MSLFLVESSILQEDRNKAKFEEKVAELRPLFQQKNIHIIEVQVSKDFSKAFFIFESESQQPLSGELDQAELSVQLIKEVRLVGKELEDIKQQVDKVNYLVEWNLPENLTMDQYLARKKQNSVHYAEVPEVKFARTYVCEDMSKCLCFYDAPDEQAVKRAREAVKAPIDAITEIDAKQ